MGIDINMYIEIKEGHQWRLAEPLVLNDDYFAEEEDDYTPELIPARLDIWRRSSLFAILADVGNPPYVYEPLGDGSRVLSGLDPQLFAIAPEDFKAPDPPEKYTPISPPRGLPVDISTELREWADWWRNQGNVFGWSWLTIQELLAFDWHGRTIQRQGMVKRQWAYLFPGDQPFPDLPSEEPITASGWHRDGVVVTWIETYAEAAGQQFLEDVLGKLREWGEPDQVRVVFWFDG